MKKQTPAFVACSRYCQEGPQETMCVYGRYTDVMVIAIAMSNQINPDELWLAFGTGSNFRYIPIHEAVSRMDPRKIAVLPVFHAFTGCDTVSSFSGRGKKTSQASLILH